MQRKATSPRKKRTSKKVSSANVLQASPRKKPNIGAGRKSIDALQLSQQVADMQKNFNGSKLTKLNIRRFEIQSIEAKLNKEMDNLKFIIGVKALQYKTEVKTESSMHPRWEPDKMNVVVAKNINTIKLELL